MNKLFNKRMELLSKSGNTGAVFVEKTNNVVNQVFPHSSSYRIGKIYDWNLREIEPIDFRFEKIKTFTGEGYQVEYHVQFRPNVNPEHQYKNRYHVADGKERFGFYLDIQDLSKNIYDKWLIVGKDDRVAFDRYNVFKCNWQLEWVLNGEYHNCLCVYRDTLQRAIGSPDKILEIGGSIVSSDITLLLPTNESVKKIPTGLRVMVSDYCETPSVFEVINRKDASPLGITKLYLRRCLFNEKTDYIGDLNNDTKTLFNFPTPIPDLLEGLGGNMHMICGAIKDTKKEEVFIPTEKLQLDKVPNVLLIGGKPTIIKLKNYEPTRVFEWRILVDGVEYKFNELQEYFDIVTQGDSLSIKAFNDVMLHYKVKVCVYENGGCEDFVEMEVIK